MRERVVENWLTSSNERTLQVPFCQLLLSEGYRVLHLSRHGEMEQGKDIIAVDPDGRPCGFQLKHAKGGKIRQRDWETFKAQIDRLVELPIKHPAVPRGRQHRALLVTNGELDEPVRTEIVDRNEVWSRKGLPTLEVITKGDLLNRFQELQTNFWPSEVCDINALLELFLADGSACLDKAKCAGLMESTLPLLRRRVGKAECKRAIASAAVFASYMLQSHQARGNHVAEVEGWVVYLAYLLALVERQGLGDRYYQGSLEVAEFAIRQSLLDLCDELRERAHLIEGSGPADPPFYQPRITWLCGLLATLGLWRLHDGQQNERDTFIREFILAHRDKLMLWGEAALPQILAVLWYLRYAMGTAEPDAMLGALIRSVTTACLAHPGRGLPDPYHDIEEVVMKTLCLDGSRWEETHAGRSYGLETLVQLFARRNWRREMRWLWPDVSRVNYCTFTPDHQWQLCWWRSESGDLVTRQPSRTQSWSELRKQAESVDHSKIPALLCDRPWVLLLFLIVYPHRLSPEPAKLLDGYWSTLY